MSNITICGGCCDECGHKISKECAGCPEGQGNVKMWDNGCTIYKCAADKQVLHCGFCEEFPCEFFIETTSKWDSKAVVKIEEIMMKQSIVQSYCGLMCNGCEWKESHSCGGCLETKGNPFHGECPIALCCINKGYSHCGECTDMPCEQLYAYSCLDKEHGDKPSGARLNVLRYWTRKA